MGRINDDLIYQTLVARRLHSDYLLWQVPALTFTGQAFLFATALGPDTRATARVVTASLSVLVSLLSMILMKRHRQNEVTDARRLVAMEMDGRQDQVSIHDRPARRGIAVELGAEGFVDRWTPSLPAYPTWMLGLFLFLLAGVAVVVIAIGWPGILER